MKIEYLYFWLRFSLILVLLLFYNNLATTQKKIDLEIKRKDKLKEIEKVENLIEKTRLNKEISMNKVNLLIRKIDIRDEIIQNLSSDIEEIKLKINLLTNEIIQRENEVINLKKEYSKIIYNSYFRLKNYNYLIFFFSSNSFNQAYRRLLYIKEYSEFRKYLFKFLKERMYNLSYRITELKYEKNKREYLVNEKEYEAKKLKEDKSVQKKLVDNYIIKESQLKNELKELQAITKIIEKEIEKIIKEEEIAKKSKNNRSGDIILTKNFYENKGKLPWPIEEGIVISFFGEHPHPVFKGILIKNNGIDISTNCNSNVVSIFNGTVSKVFAIKGANFAVIIRHGDYLTVYQNLQIVNITIGDKIKTNQVIGSSFCENSSNISTIHFEIWHELNKLNPLDWLRNKN